MAPQSRKRDGMMARLSKLQIYSIKWLNSQGKNIDEIANELNLKLTTKQMEKIITPAIIKEEPVAVVPTIGVKDLMITSTSGKNNNTIAIMTKDASAAADHARTSSSSDPRSLNKNSIYRQKK